MTFRRRLRAAVFVAGAAATVLLGPAHSAAAAPASLTLRYAAQGWTDLAQAGAAVLICPEGAVACQDGSDPTVPTGWVDIDSTESTVNSSRAVLTIPPGTSVEWAGLYWAGDRGSRADGGPPRCDGGPESAEPATPPPAPSSANQVQVAIGDGGYVSVTAASLTDVTGQSGAAAYQAYADVTALLRPFAASPAPVPVPLTVANVQVARGPGCAGGWTVVLAYSYPNGPHETYAPTYRSVAVYDGVVAAAGGATQELVLDRLVAGASDARLTTSLMTGGQALAGGLTLDGAPVALSGDGVAGVSGAPGPGYHLATSPVPKEAVKPDAAAVTAGVAPSRNAFVAAVLGLSRGLSVRVDLSVTTEVVPTTVEVGGDATLTLAVHNDAELPASGVAVSMRLPAGVGLIEAAQGYNASTGVWAVGPVPARGSVALALRIRVLRAGQLLTTAEISASDIPDTDSAPGDGLPEQDDLVQISFTVTSPEPVATTEAAQAAVPEPAAGLWPRMLPAVLFGVGLVALGLLMLLIVVIRSRTA